MTRSSGGLLWRTRTMVGSAWDEALDGWLEPFLARLTHEKRRRWAPVYVQGLLGPGDRKSLQPTAARLGLGSHDQLHHFITSPAWDDAPLRRLLVEKADALVGGPDAVLVIDDTALPKQGTHSVGVARQYCGCLGKRANGQVPSAGLGQPPCGTDDRLCRSWSRSPWPGARSRCRSGFACSCRRPGQLMRSAAPASGYRTSIDGPRPRPTSRSLKSIGSSLRAPASAACSPTRATGSAPPSAKA